MKTLPSLALLLPLSAAAPHASAQERAARGETCGGPVYERKDVTRPARVTHNPVPEYTDEAVRATACGSVRLRVVLCRDGRVTDVQVVKGPPAMAESAVRAVRGATFTPAERGGRPASQWAAFEYHLNMDAGCGQRSGLPTLAAPRPGQLVEEVQVEGNRRWGDETIMGHIRTRPGDPYNPDQVQRDLRALLALPIFDKTETHVTTTAGVRGGVVVIFTVRELPIIRDLTFAGLKTVSEEEVLRALGERGTGVSKEGVYDPVGVRAAVRVIKDLLAERGRPDASVEVAVEEVSPQSVALDFQVDEGGRRVEPEEKLEEKPWWIGPIPLWRKPPALAPHPKRV